MSLEEKANLEGRVGASLTEGAGCRQNINNLADLDQWLLSCASMPPNRRYQRRAAIRATSKWFSLPPKEISMELTELRRRFAQLSPGRLRVTRKRISNTKSALLSAIRAAGILPKLTYVESFLPGWIEIWEVLTVPEKRQLSRLFRYCSAHGVNPEQFDDAISAAFLQHLSNETLVKSPKIVHQNACRRWRRLCVRIPDFPGRPVAVPRYMQRLCLPKHLFPDTLWDEFEAFLSKMATVDYFDVRAPEKPLRPASIKAYRQRFHMFVSSLVLAGYRAETIKSLAFCVKPRQVEAGLRALLKWRQRPESGESRHSACSCAILLLTITNRTLENPDRKDVEFLKLAVRKLRVRHRGMSPRNRKKVAALKNEANLARLFIMPLKIAEDICSLSDEEITFADALLFQKALALIILMFCPLRIGTLVSLHIDRNFVWSDRDMKGSLMLNIDEDQLKGDYPALLPLPQQCVDLIRAYIKRFRPRLDPKDSQFLFTGENVERGKDANTLSRQIKALVREKLGFDVTAHVYRHLVHIIVLNRFPGAYAMVARVLTHRSINTAIQNYSYMDIELSMCAYQALVLDGVDLNSAKGRPKVEDWVYGAEKEKL